MNPGLEDAEKDATHQVYEIRTIQDFFTVPSDRRRICLREFHAWMMMQEETTTIVCATAERIAEPGSLKPSDLHWHNEVYRWSDDGKATITVQIKVMEPHPPAAAAGEPPQ